MQTKKQLPHWPRILIVAALVLVALACSTTSTSIPPVIPTRAVIPTWTPTPRPMTGTISGQVIDASTSSPVPKANIYTDPPTISVTADTQGLYVIPEAPPGVYTITATKPGYTSTSVNIAVTAGKTTTADVHLTVVPTIPSPQQMQAGLIAHWSFDNCDGTDSSGNSFHGTLYGTPRCVNGVSGKALELDGKDDWFSLQAMPKESYTVSDFSISLWFNTDQDTQQTLWQASDGSNWGLTGYGIAIKSLDDIEAGYRAEYPEKCELHATGDLEASTWHHVVLVRDTDKKQGLLYIDGDLKDVCDDPCPGLSIEPQSYPRVGYGYYAPSAYEKYFDGLIDEVCIHNRALGESEVQALYRGNEGLVAYYPFNGNANDESGNGNHGTVHGATLTSDRLGTLDSAYSFDGVDDYIEIADSTSLDIEQQITIAAWARFYSNPDGSSRIVDKSHTGCRHPWNMYGLRMCCKASRFAFDVTTHGSNHILDSVSVYPPDAWHFVVGIYDGSTQKLYVDGILDSSASASGSIGTNNEPLLIGKHKGCESQHFNGTIDDVRIYNRALSEADIQALYEQDD